MKTEIDQLWGIEDGSRLPLKANDWEAVSSKITLNQPALRSGDRQFVTEAFPGSDLRVFSGILTMLRADRAAFTKAAHFLDPAAWRLLHYRGSFSAEMLVEFRFHPAQALAKLCTAEDGFGDPPTVWLGTARNISEIAADLEIALRDMDNQTASATWLVLSLVQRAALTKAEILHCTWWDPDWLEPFLEQVVLVR